MRVRVQYATSEPGDWVEFNINALSNRWRSQPRKPVPQGEQIDMSPGWVVSVEVDGVLFEGFDHVAVEHSGLGNDEFVKVYAWTDDEDDFNDPQALGYRWGEVWEFRSHRPDPLHGGRLNTYQIKTVYADDLEDMGRFFPQTTTGGEVLLRPWAEFPMPDEAITRHGVWLPEDLWMRHAKIRHSVTWEDWA